jgi:hypothetical protein
LFLSSHITGLTTTRPFSHNICTGENQQEKDLADLEYRKPPMSLEGFFLA